MSNPKLIVLPDAEDDIRSILNYTLSTWGQDQFLEFATKLEATLEIIADNQQIGIARPELPNKMRSFSIEHHVIFYYISEGIVKVARVAHQRQDAKRIFKNR